MEQLIANLVSTKVVSYFGLSNIQYGIIYSCCVESIKGYDITYIKSILSRINLYNYKKILIYVLIIICNIIIYIKYKIILYQRLYKFISPNSVIVEIYNKKLIQIIQLYISQYPEYFEAYTHIQLNDLDKSDS